MKLEINKVPRFFNQAAGDAFCRDDCICTYAHNKGVDSRAAYIDVLRTPFEIVDGKMIPSSYHPFIQLKDMCGISIEKMEQNNSEELIHGIEKELSEDNVVCIIMRGNCCPWDWRFEETEIGGNHEFFIVGADPQKEEYQCVDPYYSIDEEILPYKYCIKGCHEVFVYKFENKVWEKEQLIKKLEQEREYWDKSLQCYHDLSDHLQQFVEESLALMNTGQELSGAFEFVNNNIIYHIMEDIANNRIRFVWFLEYLKERGMIHTDKFSEDFIDISKMWNTIKKMYVKNLYRGKTDVDNLKDKIKEISIYEKDILNQLMSSLHNETIEEEDSISEQIATEKRHYEIQSMIGVYNNYGILGIGGSQADFNGFGECFEASSFPQGEAVYVNTVPFRFEVSESGKNNLSCKKQQLDLPHKKYNRVCLLACSDWEECKDIFKLEYDDGTVENRLVEIAEWVPNRNRIPTKDCIVAKKNIRNSKTEFEKCYIYYYEIIGNSEKVMTSITFPNCENIHIFAITLIDAETK